MKVNLLRATKVGLVIGTVLGIINHYDMFISGVYTSRRIMQIILTYFVPFFVSLHGSAMYAEWINRKKKK